MASRVALGVAMTGAVIIGGLYWLNQPSANNNEALVRDLEPNAEVSINEGLQISDSASIATSQAVIMEDGLEMCVQDSAQAFLSQLIEQKVANEDIVYLLSSAGFASKSIIDLFDSQGIGYPGELPSSFLNTKLTITDWASKQETKRMDALLEDFDLDKIKSDLDALNFRPNVRYRGETFLSEVIKKFKDGLTGEVVSQLIMEGFNPTFFDVYTAVKEDLPIEQLDIIIRNSSAHLDAIWKQFGRFRSLLDLSVANLNAEMTDYLYEEGVRPSNFYGISIFEAMTLPETSGKTLSANLIVMKLLKEGYRPASKEAFIQTNSGWLSPESFEALSAIKSNSAVLVEDYPELKTLVACDKKERGKFYRPQYTRKTETEKMHSRIEQSKNDFMEKQRERTKHFTPEQIEAMNIRKAYFKTLGDFAKAGNWELLLEEVSNPDWPMDEQQKLLNALLTAISNEAPVSVIQDLVKRGAANTGKKQIMLDVILNLRNDLMHYFLANNILDPNAPLSANRPPLFAASRAHQNPLLIKTLIHYSADVHQLYDGVDVITHYLLMFEKYAPVDVVIIGYAQLLHHLYEGGAPVTEHAKEVLKRIRAKSEISYQAVIKAIPGFVL